MSLYRLTHTYSPDHMHKVISSDMSYVDLWNTIVLLQTICCEIDSSHGLNEANTVTFLTKYFDAMLHEPNSYYDAREVMEIDLYQNWEFGFMDSDKKPIRGGGIKEYEQKYDFYQKGMYSYLLEMMMRDHTLFEGEVGCESSFEMNNAIWQGLFAEGIYDIDKVKRLREAQLEKERVVEGADNPPMHKVAFSGDTPEEYHVSLHTIIERGLNGQNELWLKTTSAVEAMLVGRYFKDKVRLGDDPVSVVYKGDWRNVIFEFEYKDEEAVREALKGFDMYYARIYDELKSNSYLTGKIF